jgi:tryptophanyl-tRNA synthetase
MNEKRVVFSGIQPTGNIHLGNYIGAVRNWVAKQAEKVNYFCVVDLHSLTVPQDPENLRFEIRSLAAILLACGIDPSQCTLFVQSHVAAHSEGCWLLNCLTPIGWLQRMTQFKDKSARQETVSVGLLDYPVLMAGDIIFYDTHEVPVGDDQKQHVELTRDIAQRFNSLYEEEFFVVPEPVIPEVGARIMGLDDPSIKMSKSLAYKRGHAIRLLDEPDEIMRSFRRAVTDSGNEIRFSNRPEKAGVDNLLEIYRAITGKPAAAVEADFADARGYGDLKTRVGEVVIELLRPIQERYHYLMQDATELDRLLAKGAAQAAAVSQPKVDQMKSIMGLVLPQSATARVLAPVVE